MTRKHHFGLKSATAFAALIATFVAVAPTAASAQEAKNVHTAIQHLGLAAKAGDAAGAKRHVHHAINCLEGKSGKDFDAAAGDICKGVGADYPAGSANAMKVEKAIGILDGAEKLDDKAAVLKAADEAEKVLAEIKE